VSVLDGPGEGTWSVFAGKAVEERDAALNVNKMREELLAEIDQVLQGSTYWVGGRLDTIKRLITEVETLRAWQAEAVAALQDADSLLFDVYPGQAATKRTIKCVLASAQEVKP
jgi:hypothetical protein